MIYKNCNLTTQLLFQALSTAEDGFIFVVLDADGQDLIMDILCGDNATGLGTFRLRDGAEGVIDAMVVPVYHTTKIDHEMPELNQNRAQALAGIRNFWQYARKIPQNEIAAEQQAEFDQYVERLGFRSADYVVFRINGR